MIIKDADIDILSRLDAMIVQEETMRCLDYFNGIDAARDGDIVDEPCRGAMVTWIRQVQRKLSLDPETVWIAASFLDRYLSSGRGDSRGALRSRRKFQLAAVTAYYTAVKVYEPAALGIGMLVQICHGTYSEPEIASMEREILAALDWRVSCHTPMDFIRDLLRLLPEQLPSGIRDSVLADCRKHLESATADFYFACCRPSDVGAVCLASSLGENRALSLPEKRTICDSLSELCRFVQSPEETATLQRDLTPDRSSCRRSAALKLADPSRRPSCGMDGDSSPICVTKAAWQA